MGADKASGQSLFGPGALGGETYWRHLIDLLDDARYEELSSDLQAVLVTDDPILTGGLRAARHLSQVCQNHRRHRLWHNRVSAESQELEDELRRQLLSLLIFIAGQAGSEVLARSLADSQTQSQRSVRPPRHEPPPPVVASEPPPPEKRAADRSLPPTTTLPPDEEAKLDQPSLVVYCLGPFQVYLDEQPIEEWPSSKGKSILEYLVTHRERPVAKEILMELFWPEVDPNAARNSLNVAVYGMRQALRSVDDSFAHILFEDDRYLINQDLYVWVDVEVFDGYLRAGRRFEQQSRESSAINCYQAAEVLYRGEFLAEDRYEDWLLPRRQQLQDDYLFLVDRLSRYALVQEDFVSCIALCDKALTIDPCWEEAHYRLMRCYHTRGQRYLALRQYHQCADVLARELGDVRPSKPVEELYQQLRRR